MSLRVQDGKTALMYAARNNATGAVEALLAGGAAPDLQSKVRARGGGMV